MSEHHKIDFATDFFVICSGLATQIVLIHFRGQQAILSQGNTPELRTGANQSDSSLQQVPIVIAFEEALYRLYPRGI